MISNILIYLTLKPLISTFGTLPPELLTDSELVGFYEAVWHSRNSVHMVMIKLLIFTGLRNAELSQIRLKHVDLDLCQIRI